MFGDNNLILSIIIFQTNWNALPNNSEGSSTVALIGRLILGKKEIMQAANDTFISSTFWTERIGPTAAIKTLEIMKKIKAWKIISKTGKKIKKEWQKLKAQYYGSISLIDENVGKLMAAANDNEPPPPTGLGSSARNQRCGSGWLPTGLA